jgi:hypothetical protein
LLIHQTLPEPNASASEAAWRMWLWRLVRGLFHLVWLCSCDLCV